MADIEALLKSLTSLETKINHASSGGPDAIDNIAKRVHYSDVELLRLDVAEALIAASTDPDDAFVQPAYARMDALLLLLKLRPIRRKRPWWTILDTSMRGLGVGLFFIWSGMCFSLPLLVLRALDVALGSDPFEYVSERLKRQIPAMILQLAGIAYSVEGVDRAHYQHSCSLLTFSHASNLDGFLVSGSCPIRQLAFGKKELFMVPFFSWISLAFGGVPVDRGNRDRAVKALKRSTDLAKHSKLCIAIAPEGTRSLTGQLLPFKKGAFYMWDEMQAPLLPFVIFGAYDLYPVGSWVNMTGCVTARYLPPLLPAQASSREHMMRLLRRRMLESLRQCPESIGRDLSSRQYAGVVAANLAVIALSAAVLWGLHFRLVQTGIVSWPALLLLWALFVCFVTLGLYVYYVYVVAMLDGGGKAAKGEGEGAVKAPAAASPTLLERRSRRG
ncbi:hypothetical protein B484DRAFT_445525 [Ochromonadaceae sp. CCMP2298]|nr:hypothetical protein B484DRAFT_445525 [Ochromonadaceae sp. CCMP2298]|mmetsp:Transcript_31575/g.69572  ORF Transcript_31575/g.69572 Transcript_31575/m.69572 type:complete len:444 (+) Transcript_31575:116-1447(+)